MLYFQELDKYVIVFNKNVIVGFWNKASFNIIGGDCFSICVFLQIEGGEIETSLQVACMSLSATEGTGC